MDTKKQTEKNEKGISCIDIFAKLLLPVASVFISGCVLFNNLETRTHNTYTENFNYGLFNAPKEIVEEAKKNYGEKSTDISSMIGIDVKTGKLNKYAVIQYNNDKIETIPTTSVPVQEYDGDPYITVNLSMNEKQNAEVQGDKFYLSYFLYLEGTDGSTHLNMVVFECSKEKEIIEYHFFSEIDMINEEPYGNKYPNAFEEYNTIYEELHSRGIV